MVFNLVRCLAD